MEKLIRNTLHRLNDIDHRAVSIGALRQWPTLTFAELQRALEKRFKSSIAVAERDEWETWFTARKAEAAELSSAISGAEAEIDRIVYRLFDLTPTEIAAIEDALALASPGLSLKAYEAISAVEGLHLSDEARERLSAADPTADRQHGAPRANAA